MVSFNFLDFYNNYLKNHINNNLWLVDNKKLFYTISISPFNSYFYYIIN